MYCTCKCAQGSQAVDPLMHFPLRLHQFSAAMQVCSYFICKFITGLMLLRVCKEKVTGRKRSINILHKKIRLNSVAISRPYLTFASAVLHEILKDSSTVDKLYDAKSKQDVSNEWWLLKINRVVR